jgi:glucans biosynthesis protein
MLPHGPDFAVDLLPPGLYFPDPVKVDRMTDDGLREIAFRPGLFSFEPRYFDTIPDTSPGAGFSGMRLRHPLNDPARMDEVLVIQGASYFRAIGQAMVYGLSARAVAIGTGGAAPEEFPRFTHLRLHPAKVERCGSRPHRQPFARRPYRHDRAARRGHADGRGHDIAAARGYR